MPGMLYQGLNNNLNFQGANNYKTPIIPKKTADLVVLKNGIGGLGRNQSPMSTD
jgi:hypothetical protein